MLGLPGGVDYGQILGGILLESGLAAGATESHEAVAGNDLDRCHH